MLNKLLEDAYNKKYNIEWYLANGDAVTTSAVLVDSRFGYLYFTYPEGGLLIIERKALRSMSCLED